MSYILLVNIGTQKPSRLVGLGYCFYYTSERDFKTKPNVKCIAINSC